jgi:hypothetical protein
VVFNEQKAMFQLLLGAKLPQLNVLKRLFGAIQLCFFPNFYAKVKKIFYF